MVFVANTKVPVRSSLPGRETSLVSDFLQSGVLRTPRYQSEIFNEPKLPTGFPDIVAVYLGDVPLSMNPSRNALTHTHLRLLHHLCSVKKTSVTDIISDLGWRGKMLDQTIEALSDADLIYRRGSRIFARELRKIFAVRKIVAIEAKVDNWARGLQQASSNTWFASHSYLLIPENRNVAKVKSTAQALGVGVMIFDGDETRTIVTPRVSPLPSSYGSWLFNEWSVRRLFGSPHTC